MTKDEAIAYLENPSWYATRFGLGRTRALLGLLGDPQKKLRFIHVAGSNGKGSTCAMIERILRCAGYKTGMFSSPYLEDYCEQLRICGGNIPEERLAELTGEVKNSAEAMEEHPTRFELLTALGMLFFAQEKCEIVILEAGMGGALDSTNVIDSPEAAVLTNIGLEHTEYLGDTLTQIASVKAGIIKPGCECICYPGEEEAVSVIRRICEKKAVPFHLADFMEAQPDNPVMENSEKGNCGKENCREKNGGKENCGEKNCGKENCREKNCGNFCPENHGSNGQSFSWRGREYYLSLPGIYQIRNAAVALETVHALRGRGWKIPEEAVREGLRTVSWPARMELLGNDPVFLLDGGHNPQCAKVFAESLVQLFPGKRFIFLTGVLKDKDYPAIFEELFPLAKEFVCLTPENPARALTGDELAEFLRGRGAKAVSADSYEDGIKLAVKKAEDPVYGRTSEGREKETAAVLKDERETLEGKYPVAAFGSLYMAGRVRRLYKKIYGSGK